MFPKAKVKRFNENIGCAPGVGSYDPKLEPKVPGAVFEKSERFKSVPNEPAEVTSTTLSRSSQRSRSSNTSSVSSISKSARKKVKERLPSDYENVPVFDEPSNELIEKLKKENAVLRERVRNLQSSLYAMQKRQSFSSPPNCCSSPLLRFFSPSPSPVPKVKRINSRSGSVTAIAGITNNAQSIAIQPAEKHVSITIDKSPVTKDQVCSTTQQLTPENREFIEAKHTALIKLSKADDEIYRLMEQLKDYEQFKEKFVVYEKEMLEKELKNQELKTELQENQAFFSTLKENFQEQNSVLEIEVSKLNKMVSELNEEICSLNKNSIVKDENIEQYKMKLETEVQEKQSWFDAYHTLKKTLDDLTESVQNEEAKFRDEIQSLRQVVAENIESVAQLKTQAIEAEVQLRTKQSSLHDFDRQTTSLKEQISELYEENHSLKEALDLGSENIEQLKTKVVNTDLELREKQMSFDALKESSECQISKLMEEVSQSIDERHLLKQSVEFKDKEIEQLKSRVIKSEMELREKQSSFDTLKESSECQISKLQEEVSQSIDERHLLKQSVELKDIEIEQLKTRVINNEIELREKQSSFEVLKESSEGQILTLENEVSQINDERHLLEQTVELKDKEIEQLKTRVINNEIELRENQSSFDTLKQSLKCQILTIEEEAIKINDERNLLKQTVELKDEKIEQLKTRVINTEIELREKQSSFDALKETVQEQINKHNDTVSNLRNEILTLKSNLSQKCESEEQLMIKYVALKESIAKMKIEQEDNAQKANDEIELLTTEMEDYRNQIREKIDLEEELKRQLWEVKKQRDDTINEMKQNETLAEEKYANLKEKFENSFNDRKQIEEKLNQEIQDLNCQLLELERRCLNLKLQAETTQQLQYEKQELEEQFSMANDEVNKLQEMKEQLTRENYELQNEITIKHSDNITLKIELDKQGDLIKEQDDCLVNLKLTLEEKDREIEKLQADIEVSVNKYEETLKHSSNLQSTIETLKESEICLATEINNLRSDRQTLRDENTELILETSNLQDVVSQKDVLGNCLLEEIDALRRNEKELQRFVVENQVLKDELEKQTEKFAKQMNEYEEKVNDTWRRLIEKNNEVKHKSVEIESLKDELKNAMEKTGDFEKWKNLYEELLVKVEPFKDQLDAYAHERSLLVNETDQALKQLNELQKKYSESMGHSNHKQKIQYLCQLQSEIRDLRTENVKLRDMNYKQSLIIQKYKPAESSASAKSKAKKTNVPLKENTPSAFF